ncbi:hypothetical protein L3Q82_014378 [Scortum barcoo]|uniref:Uncharacterized protein n=1 Tax=Scortum barcoo TaxID=214431 RepID=A0ACB8VX23_9TELE|nr:hypothetical protein L3Q82_014378 [Scortum barcoo]
MTHVHYKFSSKLSYDTVVFDGPHITLRDLKRQIMGREKLRAGDCDLQITNAQTKEEYTDDDGLIPKGSSVIIRRIPIIGVKSSSSSKTRNIERSDVHLHHASGAIKAMDDQSFSTALPFFSKMANLADADVSEEDKIKVMINQSSYDSMNYSKKFGAVLPANYTCYRCGNTGLDHIRNCPTSGQDKNFETPLRIKKSTGIPRSFMVEVDDPNIKGAMLTNCGRYAIPAIDAQAYAIGKKEKPPFFAQEQPKSEGEEDPIPDELLCLICHDLLSDAVVIPCCGNSYCDDCIRTALLDSEEHVCPTCSQSDVSPDTLIANKFLRQAVNNFRKEQGFTKGLRGRCSTSQSQNPTPTLSPTPTSPPLIMRSQPQSPLQSTHSQQDPLLHQSQAAETPPLTQVTPTVTGPASAPNVPSTSSTLLQLVQSHPEMPEREAEEKTCADSAAAAPSVLVSHKDPTAAPTQLIPLVNHTPAVEKPQTVSVNMQQSGPSQRPSGPPSCWDGSSSSSGCPIGGWKECNTQQLPPTSSSSSCLYPTTPPPLFPSPHFHTFLTSQQPLNSYPPGYPPTAPIWTLPTLQGSPIPSLCPSTSTSSIPALIPKEWYMHERKKTERSPHRRSTYRRSSPRSKSKSSKSRSFRSYSRSSSRSRSRSRSKGRSRPHSPYSHRHTHSHSTHSYSYGYKRSRSPTPSSSSSPQVGYDSRSKSPSHQRKNSHHSRHHNKKSSSGGYSSRRRGEGSRDKAGVASYMYAQHANQTSSLEVDRERYMQWKREYKEWCEKYFNSYVGHFHQLSQPLHSLVPSPLLPWGEREGGRNPPCANSETHTRLPGRRTTRMEDRSPPSQSSSDSRSPPSQSSSDSRSPPSQSSSNSRSMPSQSSSDSHSSPSHSSNDSRSPPSQSSSDSLSTPSEERAQHRSYQQRCDEKYSCTPGTLKEAEVGNKELELEERSKAEKEQNVENPSTLKHNQKSMKKHEEERGEESSSPGAADSTDNCRKDKRSDNTEPNASKDGTPAQDETTGSEALQSVQLPMKPDKRLDEDYERKSRKDRNLEDEKGWQRGKYSYSREGSERQHKEKPSKGVDTDRYRNRGSSKDSDSRSEKNRKRKGEDTERHSVQSSKCPKTKFAEEPKTCKTDSPNSLDSKRQKAEKVDRTKKDRKTWPLTEKDIWEGGIKVKPQKKISININLDGKKKEDKTEKQDFGPGRTKEETERSGNKEDEKLNKGETGVNEKKEYSRDQEGVSEEKIQPDVGAIRQTWEKVTFRDDKREMWKTIAGEEKDAGEKKKDREEEDVDLWHCAFRGMEEEKKKEGKKQLEEGDMTEASTREVTNDERRSMRGDRRVRNDSTGREMGELVPGIWKDRTAGETTCEELMEGVKWRMRTERTEDTMMSKLQKNRDEIHRGETNTTVDKGSVSFEDHQERKTVLKTLEEFTQDRAADKDDELIFIQVPRSKWEKEESEEEEQVKVFLPPPSMSATAEILTSGEREKEDEQKRQKLMEREGGRDVRREKNSTLSTSHRSVAPSSGNNRSDSTSWTDRDRGRRMETERPRDRERGRESERPKDRQKDSKRSKGRTREEEKGTHRERERGHGSSASLEKRNHPSSSHSYSTSHDAERRDRQRGGDQDSNKSSSCPDGKASRSCESSETSRATEVPDENKTYRDISLDSKFKDKDHSHYYDRQQNRPAGTHHSTSILPLSLGKERDPVPAESSAGSEHKVEKGEWKRNKVDKVIKEGKGERENQEKLAWRRGGGRWEDEANKLGGQNRSGGGERSGGRGEAQQPQQQPQLISQPGERQQQQ